MRKEARIVLSDGGLILPDPHAASLIADDPAAEYGITPIELRGIDQRLANEPLRAIVAAVAVDDPGAVDEADIGAFARIERLTRIASAKLGGARIVLEKGRQQVGMAGLHPP